jgi:hypothetical protein
MATPSAAPIWRAVLLRPEARGEPGLVLGDAREGGDRSGHEGGANAGAEDEQPEEDVCEVGAAHR